MNLGLTPLLRIDLNKDAQVFRGRVRSLNEYVVYLWR